MPIVVRNQSTGLLLYARFDDASNTAVNLTEGSGLKVGRYAAADAAIVTAGLAAGTYSVGVFIGTAGAQANTDTMVAEIPEFKWSGSAEIITSTSVADILADTTVIPAFPTNFGALGINASGHVSRVTLADTITTYTGNTLQTGDSFARIGVNGAGLTAIQAGVSEPMVNFDPPSGFIRLVPQTGIVALPIRVNAGPLDEVVPLDMSAIYGKASRVLTVGAPTISGGSITVSSVGPHLSYAYIGLGGTATAGEDRTVTVEIAMRGGQSRTVQFRIIVAN